VGLQNNITKHQHDVTQYQRSTIKNQKPCILWFTGLSSSGKSSIANALELKLNALHKHTYLLDGDNIRLGLNNDLGFSDAHRVENIRRIGEVAKLFVHSGTIVLTAFISPFRKDREFVKNLVKNHEFIEIFVNTNLELCEKRDTKGLYKKARLGEIPNFTGISSAYEVPLSPHINLATQEKSINDCANKVMEYLKKGGYLNA